MLMSTYVGETAGAMTTIDRQPTYQPQPRQLSGRQSSSIGALLSAGLEVLGEVGYGALSIRTVATRAGVTHTTAYTYFSSKAHLVAEIFWSRLQSVPPTAFDPVSSFSVRVTEALSGPARLLAAESFLCQAGMAALLSDEPDVRRLRDMIGADLTRRVAAACGEDADKGSTEAIVLAFDGAMLLAGMGYFGAEGVVQRVERVANLLERRQLQPGAH